MLLVHPPPYSEPPAVIIDEAILAEATDLCRDLTAHFPDNTDYQKRLDGLIRLHARRFGHKNTPNP